MWTPTLDDVLNAPRDPDDLRVHLQSVGALPTDLRPTALASPPIQQLVPPNIPPSGPAVPLRPPTRLGGEHLPAMKTSELAEPSGAMTPPIVSSPDAISSGGPVKPMTAPTLTGGPGAFPGMESSSGLPVGTPGAPQGGSLPFYQSELNRAVEANRHDSMGDHPSFMGKVGHVLGRVGNVALNAFVPGLAETIPGTDAYKVATEQRAKRELAGEQERESKEKLQTAETAEAEARAKKLGGEDASQDFIIDKAGNIRGWKDAKGIHSLEDANTPQAIKDIAKVWEGTPDKQKRAENIEQMMAGRIQDVYAAGGDPATDKQLQFLEQEKEKLVNQKEGQPKPSEEDKAIDDYLQGHKLANTPQNRDRARSILKTRDRSAADEETKELRKELLRAQVEKSKEATPDEQRRADLANNLNENLDKLEDIATRRPELFGPYAGRGTAVRQWWGTDDPDIATLKQIEENTGLAMVGAHAMRNAQHAEKAAQSITGANKNTADALLAPNGPIANARASVQTFIEDSQRRRNAIAGAGGGGGGEGGGGAAKHPKAGDVVGGYKFKGGNPNDKNNWEKAGNK